MTLWLRDGKLWRQGVTLWPARLRPPWFFMDYVLGACLSLLHLLFGYRVGHGARPCGSSRVVLWPDCFWVLVGAAGPDPAATGGQRNLCDLCFLLRPQVLCFGITP